MSRSTKPDPQPMAAPPAPPLPELNPDGIDVHLDAHGNRRIVERRFVVEERFHGHRLDHYLKRKIPRLSRTKLQRIIRSQLEPVRGRTLKPHSAVMTGDVIIMRTPARPEPPCPRTFTVLHDDPQMMVIDKPAGLPVHASARYYFNTLTRVLSERYPGQDVQICHRLDRETSGLLVLARGRQAAARIKGAFAAHKVQKTYLAVVHGQPPWPDGPPPGPTPPGNSHAIDLPLGLVRNPDALIDIRMEVRHDASPATTLVWVVERCPGHALVACVPVTGRQHQIRAHLAAVGHAIVGDKLYAHGDEAFARFCDQGMTPDLASLFQLPRHALHAACIAVPHPDGPTVKVTSSLPADLRAFLDDTREGA
jgi:23S rRNA pseudouridine1911/1915/1917 synthase